MSVKNEDAVSGSPTPEEIISMAQSVGYKERREMVSSTLFFVEISPPHDMPACLINVYYTTRSIMTHLNHPGSAGTNELWRSNAYDTLEELRTFFGNPRVHTGKGYRNARKAVRGCAGCGMMKTRGEFSKNQWTVKGPDRNKCKDCVAQSKTATYNTNNEDASSGDWADSLNSELKNLTLMVDGSTFPSLTEDLLQMHDAKVNKKLNKSSSGGGGDVTNDLVRRQFNCPDCPRYGRGSQVFFKKVPALKPICKCPRCKRASRGKCRRLYPVPKEEEKGYGLYKCTRCGDKWGSSRAVANIGQECFSCAKKDETVLVIPFRLEKHRRKKGSGAGARGMRRIPKEPIREDEPDERAYGDADRERNDFGGNTSRDTSEKQSFKLEPRENHSVASNFDSSVSSVSSASLGFTPVGVTSRIPSGYKHKCAGCATGKCKNRRIPFSQVHDISDGNTVSTSASLMTNSSIDKTDFIDRDEDFRGFEEKSDRDWVQV